jgi:hydrogenase maturation protease
VLCLGNEVLADDAVGFWAAERLVMRPEIACHADVEFAARAGFALLDLLAGRSRVLIVDSICLGGDPGTIHYFPLRTEAPGRHLTCSHQLSLPAALALGSRLGYELPEQIDILAVEAKDVTTLGGRMTPEVSESLSRIADLASTWAAGLPMDLAATTLELHEHA